MNYPFSIYEPSERFAELATTNLAEKMWHCLSQEENVELMVTAIQENKPPIEPIDTDLARRFSNEIESSNLDENELRILCMNMMKQLLEYIGYSHVGCALCPNGKFVKSAGIFQKIGDEV